MKSKKAIIIGASSGIGHALARHLSHQGYHLGLTGRRRNLLDELARNLPNPAFVSDFDISQTAVALDKLNALIKEMDGVELIVINAGVGKINKDLRWEDEALTLDVNVKGFAAMAGAAFNYFKHQGKGHLVGLSSIIAIKGSARAPAYSASKTFVSAYLDCLRRRKNQLHLPITVTDIKPGFVDTPMTRDNPHMFWVAPTDKVAKQIYTAIRRKRSHTYVSKRWAMIGVLMKYLPDFLFYRF